MKSEKIYDSIHMGRSSIDLYSNDVGSPFEKINSFAAYVGGSPTNISVGAGRLGLKTVLLTGLGEDPVGDFIESFLKNEGISMEFSPRKKGKRSSAVVLGIEPPDNFPLMYYRDNCADIELSIDDVLATPIAKAKVFQFAGTNLCKEPSRSATFYAAECAKKAGSEVVLDLDFRPDQWHDVRAFGVAIRAILPLVDIVIGTEDELKAMVLTSREGMSVNNSQVSDTRVEGNLQEAIDLCMSSGPKILLEKCGPLGARAHYFSGGERQATEVSGFPVEVQNILGAGDAFASGFLYGHVKGWDIIKATRLGNACGAIVVTKHGCANFMPTLEEVMSFVKPHGGL